LVVETLTFKLAIDFFRYLSKNKINLENTRLSYYDRVKREYVGYSSIANMQSYFDENYLILDNCILGDLVSIETFGVSSDVYNFNTDYIGTDVTSNYKLVSGSSYDRERNSQWSILKNRQIGLVNNAVADYLKFYNEIKKIYITGIYAPCYAEPGWSRNTWYLKSLKEGLLRTNPVNQFPYDNAKIEKEPPT